MLSESKSTRSEKNNAISPHVHYLTADAPDIESLWRLRVFFAVMIFCSFLRRERGLSAWWNEPLPLETAGEREEVNSSRDRGESGSGS